MKRQVVDLTTPESSTKRARLNSTSVTPSKPPKAISKSLSGTPLTYRLSNSTSNTSSQPLYIIPGKDEGKSADATSSLNGVSSGSQVSDDSEGDTEILPQDTQAYEDDQEDGEVGESDEHSGDEDAKEEIAAILKQSDRQCKQSGYDGPCYANIQRIKTPEFEQDSMEERDRNPSERPQCRIYRVLTTQAYPKRTVSYPERPPPLTEAQQRTNYANNMATWVESAEKDGCTFDVEDTIPDFDFAETVDLAQQEFKYEMVRDAYGVWQKKSEVEAGGKTIINENVAR